MTTVLRIEHASPRTADVATLRRTVRVAAQAAGATALDDIELVAAELIANAVVHGVAPVIVHARLVSHHRIRLEVEDHSPTSGLPQNAGRSMAESGRGLVVIAALSEQWGWHIADDQQRKVVWAEVGLDGVPDDAADVDRTDA